MKRKLLTMALLLALGFISQAKDIKVTINDLPAKAREFITTYFAKQNVVSVMKDIEDNEFTVRFDDNTKIEFDRKGEWLDLSNKVNCLTTAFLVPQITNYIESNHSGYCVNEIDKERSKVKIELDNNMELVFRLTGEFLYYDD